MNDISSLRVMKAKSAVIMSVYLKDSPFPLHCCLWSLVNQTSENFIVLLCIDGELTPATKRVIDYYDSHYDFILTFTKDDNSGLANSLNYLIEIALKSLPSVEFFFRMDADDICHLNRIAKQVSFLNAHYDVDVMGTACKEFGLYSKTIYKYEHDYDIKKTIIKLTPFIHPTVVFRKRVFDDGVRYPENTHLSEDLSLWLYLAKNGYKFHNIKDILLSYRLNKNTLIRRMSFRKAFSELRARHDYVIQKGGGDIKDYFFIIAHLVIRFLPVHITKVIYKIFR